LLQYRNRNPLTLQGGKYWERVVVLSPGHGILGAEGRLVEVLVVRGPGITGQVDVLDPSRVRGSEDGAHVVNGANIMNQNADGMSRERLELIGFGTIDFIPTQLAHGWSGEDVK